MPGRLDDLRSRAFGLLGARGRKLNDALGRPLAPAEEIEDRRAFAAGYHETVVAAPGHAPAVTKDTREGVAAPVIVYHLDKHRRDLPRFTQVLDAADIPYKIVNLEGDEATLAAVRRDAGGKKLPLVFVAGDCIGGREEMTAMDRSGELRRRVWGSQ
jgi:glutaredoxin